MRFLLPAVTAGVALLALAAPAGAATVGGNVREDEGTMQFRAGSGVANRVTVRPLPGGRFDAFYLVIERAERLRASGDCRQVSRHKARCPQTKSDPELEIVLRGRADRVNLEHRCPRRGGCSRITALVRGGGGDDVIGGGGEFYGNRGDDVLRAGSGVKSWDRFHGGPGSDLMVGRGPSSKNRDDIFYDDETDAQATPDVIRGGRDARAYIDYSMRTRRIFIDLRDGRLEGDGDVVSGVKRAIGGAGNDVLVGSGGANTLAGGPGDDHLIAKGGDDELGGGAGDDLLRGGPGDDRLEEIHALDLRSADRPSGRDIFVGGGGADEAESLDTSEPDGEIWPDDVRCDADDRAVLSDPADILRRCFEMRAWDVGASRLVMQVVPQLTDEGAVFTLYCTPTEFDESSRPRCRGEIVLTRAEDAAEIGRRSFEFTNDDPVFWPQVTVTVPLSDAGRAAIQANEVIGVRLNAFSDDGFTFPPAGYRAQLGAA